MLSVKQEQPEKPEEFAECDVCGIPAYISKNAWWTNCKTPECGGRLVFPRCPPNMRYYRSFCKNEVSYYRLEDKIDASICHFCDEPYNTYKSSIIEVRCGQLVYKAEHKKGMDDEIKEMKKSMAKAVAAQKQEKEVAERLQKENEELKKDKNTMIAKVKQLEKDNAAKEVELKTLRNLIDKMTPRATPSATPRDQGAVDIEDLSPPPPAKRGRRRKSTVDEIGAEPQSAPRRNPRRSARN